MSNRTMVAFIVAALLLTSLLLWYSYEVMRSVTEVARLS